MEDIQLEIYNLFCEHGSELLWVDDPNRFLRPIGTNEKTDEMFLVLEKLDHRLSMIATGLYSRKMTDMYKEEVEKMKTRVSNEVYEIMEGKYK